MTEGLDNKPKKQDFFDKALDYLKGFGKRILVHICAILCAAVMASSSGGSFVFFGTYLGLICLVARESAMNTKWLTPTVFGLVQLLLCLIFGLPIHQCIFWGGVQAFVQRVFAKRYDMGFEWIVTIFLLPVALGSLQDISNLGLLLISFAGLAFAGGSFWRFYKPKGKKFERIIKNTPESTKQETNFKESDDPFEDYRKSIAKIRIKQILLPKRLQTSLQALTMSAEAIIICMTNDKRDVESGKRFLNRYLPAAHSVLDNYSRHAKSATNNEQVAKALSQSEDVLIRLEKAFAYEHDHLLKNDIDDFSAELNVLDTLLKMEGR